MEILKTHHFYCKNVLFTAISRPFVVARKGNDHPYGWSFPFLSCLAGLERAAPVRTLVQKVSGGHFLARGRIHDLSDASGTDVYGRSFWLYRDSPPVPTAATHLKFESPILPSPTQGEAPDLICGPAASL